MVTMNFRYSLLAVSLVLVTFAFAQDDLELRVEVLEVDVAEIKNDVEHVETDVSQNTGQLFEVVNDIDDIDDSVSTHDQQISALTAENTELRLRLEQTDARVGELEQMVNSLSGDVQVLNETVSDLDVDNSTIERLDSLESDVIGLENDVTGLENDVTGLENDVIELADDITMVENTVQELNASTDQRLSSLEESDGDYSDTVFLATISAETFTPGDPIVFDAAILNPGGHYSTTLGVYTVPLDGIYEFVVHYQNVGDISTGILLEVDNVEVAFVRNADYSLGSANMVMLLSLTAGQQVWLSPYWFSGEMAGTDETGVIVSWFSGHLLYPM